MAASVSDLTAYIQSQIDSQHSLEELLEIQKQNSKLKRKYVSVMESNLSTSTTILANDLLAANSEAILHEVKKKFQEKFNTFVNNKEKQQDEVEKLHETEKKTFKKEEDNLDDRKKYEKKRESYIEQRLKYWQKFKELEKQKIANLEDERTGYLEQYKNGTLLHDALMQKRDELNKEIYGSLAESGQKIFADGGFLANMKLFAENSEDYVNMVSQRLKDKILSPFRKTRAMVSGMFNAVKFSGMFVKSLFKNTKESGKKGAINIAENNKKKAEDDLEQSKQAAKESITESDISQIKSSVYIELLKSIKEQIANQKLEDAFLEKVRQKFDRIYGAQSASASDALESEDNKNDLSEQSSKIADASPLKSPNATETPPQNKSNALNYKEFLSNAHNLNTKEDKTYKSGDIKSDVDEVNKEQSNSKFRDKLFNYLNHFNDLLSDGNKTQKKKLESAAKKSKSGFFSNIFGRFGNLFTSVRGILSSSFTNLGKFLTGPMGRALGGIAGAALMLKDGIAGAGKAKEWVGRDDAQGKTVSAIGGALAGTGPGIGEGNAIDTAKNIAGGAMKGAAIGMMFGPLGALIGAGVGAVFSAIGGKRIAQFLNWCWDGLKSFFSMVWEGVKKVGEIGWKILKFAIQLNPIGFIIMNFDSIKNFILNVWEKIKNIFPVAIEKAKTVLTSIISFLWKISPYNIAWQAGKAIWGWVKSAWEKIKSFLGLGEEKKEDSGGGIWEKIKTFASYLNPFKLFKFIGSKIYNFALSTVSKIMEFFGFGKVSSFSEYFDKLKEIGSKLNPIKFVKTIWTAIIKVIKKTAKKIIEFLPDCLVPDSLKEWAEVPESPPEDLEAQAEAEADKIKNANDIKTSDISNSVDIRPANEYRTSYNENVINNTTNNYNTGNGISNENADKIVDAINKQKHGATAIYCPTKRDYL